MNWLTFEANGKSKAVQQNDVAFVFPSIVDMGATFITLKNGKQYRAQNLKEIVLGGVCELGAAEILQL